MMSTFVQGTIVEQEGCYGDYYEMKLRLATGQVLPLNYDNVRDPRKPPADGEEGTTNDPISDLLELGASYELLTVLGLRHLTYALLVPTGTIFKVETKVLQNTRNKIRRNEIRQGKVLDPDWNVASMDYLAISSNANIYRKHYALLETAIGKVLLNHRDIQFELGEQAKQLAPDGYLEWQNGGLILLAIIAKHPPKPEDDSFSSQDEIAADEGKNTFSGFDTPGEANKRGKGDENATSDEGKTFQGFDTSEEQGKEA